MHQTLLRVYNPLKVKSFYSIQSRLMLKGDIISVVSAEWRHFYI